MEVKYAMHHDRHGWRVVPPPDGRGMPEVDKARPPHRLPIFWFVVFLLLFINWGAALMIQPAGADARPRDSTLTGGT